MVGTRYRGVLTDIRLDATVGSTSLDRIQIGQVIINLVRNAVEAMETSEQRELAVATRAADAAVEITVSDTGAGIGPEIAARLFQPFVTTKPTGLGLGLSICREIVEAHGGQLTAASGDTGGTVFTMRLPITPDGADHDRPGR